MANPVTDNLANWQNDADSLDTNQPNNATAMGDGQAGDLDGEFRRVKSEIRAESLIKSWERWKGLKNNVSPAGNIAFTFSSGTVFTINDNFLTATRMVAVVGRRVRALLSGSTIYGTITVATFSNPTTTVTVLWDSGAMDGTLSEIQFGAELRSIGGVQNVSVSPVPPTIHQIWRFNGTLMVPSNEVGIVFLTNRTGGALAAGDVVTIDVSNDNSVVLGDTASTRKQLLVSLDAPANLATGRFLANIAPVNVTGAVVRGNYLVKSVTSLLAADSLVAHGDLVGAPEGAFAIAVSSTAGPGAGVVYAVLLGQTKATQFATFPSTQAFGDAAAAGTSELVARGDHKHAMPTLIYHREPTQLVIANTVTQTTLYSFTVGQNDLGTDKALKIFVGGDYLNNTGVNRTFILRVKFGTGPVTIFEDTSPVIQTNAARRAFELSLVLANQNSAAAQVMTGRIELSDDTAPAVGIGNLGLTNLIKAVFGGSTTQDTTAIGGTPFAITIQHNVADAALDIRRQYAFAELI